MRTKILVFTVTIMAFLWSIDTNAQSTTASNTYASTSYLGWSVADPLIFKINGTQLMTLTSAGYLGIGTTSPGAKLDIESPKYSTDAQTVKAGVAGSPLQGLGTAGGDIALYTTLGSGTNATVFLSSIYNDGSGTTAYGVASTDMYAVNYFAGPTSIGTSAGGGYLQVSGSACIGYSAGTGSPAVKNGLTVQGHVLIGETSQTNTAYLLDVAGEIRANELTVNTTGADFVFDKDYSLMNLSDLEKSINANKHLPGVPSASEMQKNGMSVGETNKVLLQKVEELTLYLIDQDKKIEKLQQDNKSLRKEVEAGNNK